MNYSIISGGVKVKLSGGKNLAEGRVDILVNGAWGSLCDKNFGFAEARALCGVLGYRYVIILLIK